MLKDCVLKKPKQFKFNDPLFKETKAFGGSLLKKAKGRTARPLSTKNAIHISLKANYQPQRGGFLNKHNHVIVLASIQSLAKKYGIKVYEIGVQTDHIHFLIKLSNRYTYASFIRALTGSIAIKISKANKFKSLKKRFWRYRPFSRIIAGGRRSFQTAREYIVLNKLEAMGIIDYQINRLKFVDKSLLKFYYDEA